MLLPIYIISLIIILVFIQLIPILIYNSFKFVINYNNLYEKPLDYIYNISIIILYTIIFIKVMKIILKFLRVQQKQNNLNSKNKNQSNTLLDELN